MKSDELISRGIIDLQREQPFFALLVMRLAIQEFPANMIVDFKTAAVDAKGNMYYDADYISKLSRSAIKGLLAHETMHCALCHFLRLGNRNLTVANIAQDMVINMIVTKANMQMPKGSIPYDAYNDECSIILNNVDVRIGEVSEKSWEIIYDELIQLFKDNKIPLPKVVYVGFDVHLEGENALDDTNSGLNASEELSKWASALAEAAVYAKRIGQLPAGMERFVDGLLKPKISWREQLLNYLRPMLNPVDYSYRKPHKKSLALGVYVPNIEREHLVVEVLVDTSGSMSDDELKGFLSEIVSIAENYQNAQMFVTFCDAEVQGRYEVSNGDIPKLFKQKCKGGGGTILEKGLDDIEQKGEASVVIVLTDGYNDFKHKTNVYPFDILWVVSANGDMKHIPYGDVLSLGDRND